MGPNRNVLEIKNQTLDFASHMLFVTASLLAAGLVSVPQTGFVNGAEKKNIPKVLSQITFFTCIFSQSYFNFLFYF